MQAQNYRALQGDEIDSLHQDAKMTVESLRDQRNNSLTLGEIIEDGEEAITCPVDGINVVDDFYTWTRILKKNFPGSRLTQERNPNGVARTCLVLPKYVKETGRPGVYGLKEGGGGGGPRKPSTDRAMLLVVVLIVLCVILWGRL